MRITNLPIFMHLAGSNNTCTYSACCTFFVVEEAAVPVRINVRNSLDGAPVRRGNFHCVRKSASGPGILRETSGHTARWSFAAEPRFVAWRDPLDVPEVEARNPRKVSCIPLWALNCVIVSTRMFSRHQVGMMPFFGTGATSDSAAPAFGTYTLKAHC